MKRVKSFLLGFLLGALIFSSITVFADMTEIKAFLSDIKVNFDGKMLNLKDSEGNKITPIVYNGTTYLPVRVIAESLGKEVHWEQDTNTIKILSKKETGGDVMKEIQYIKEGNLNIVVFEGKRYVNPISITKELNIDYKMQIVAGEVDRENLVVDFYHRKISGEPLIKNYPVVLLNISSHSFAIPYDDYKNDLLPKILESVREQN